MLSLAPQILYNCLRCKIFIDSVSVKLLTGCCCKRITYPETSLIKWNWKSTENSILQFMNHIIVLKPNMSVKIMFYRNVSFSMQICSNYMRMQETACNYKHTDTRTAGTFPDLQQKCHRRRNTINECNAEIKGLKSSSGEFLWLWNVFQIESVTSLWLQQIALSDWIKAQWHHNERPVKTSSGQKVIVTHSLLLL